MINFARKVLAFIRKKIFKELGSGVYLREDFLYARPFRDHEPEV